MSPRRRLFLVGAGLIALALILSFFAYWQTRAPTVHPVSQTERGPVMLVPGYGGSTSALDVLAEALRAKGRETVVVPLAGGGTGDLHQQAEVLDRAVDAALARSDASSVDVVGYSAGGVIARLWVADLGGAAVTRRVVTLGSPHHGTDVAGFANALVPNSCPTACQQLAADSDLLHALNADDETPDGPLWVSVWSTSDQLVVPPETAALDGAVNFSVQQVCGEMTIEHGDLPRTAQVIALTMYELRRALPRVPSAQDC